MKSRRSGLWMIIGWVVLGGSALAQSVPDLINYQGKLMDGTNLFNGIVPIVFRLYDEPVGGISPLCESSNDVVVVDGLYSAYIGDSITWGSLDDALSAAEVWVEVEIDGQIIEPRERLVSVAYARFASRLPPNAVTSDMIDWTTMPTSPEPLRGYAESGDFSTAPVASGNNAIAQGFGAQASAEYSVVSGGYLNQALAFGSTIGGGVVNTASGWRSTIGGGLDNTASGDFSTIPGGRDNSTVNYAFAAGRRAKANHAGSFVWGDSTNADISSTVDNQVLFRCNGGVRFQNADGTLYAQWWPGAISWMMVSDQKLKENFVPVNTADVLARVVALPMSEWNYIGYPNRHIGVMAQDFHAAFPFEGSTDNAIDSGDLHGVALAAIQGLNSKVQHLETENAELKARLERLEAMLGAQVQ